MANKIQIRRDTAANWTSTNPTLSQGEQGYEIDTSKFKIGDGTTAWTSLSYFSGYTDADVDTHLNTSTATSGEVLSWTGTDYDWITAGGGGADLYAANESSPSAQPSATGANAISIGDSAISSGSDSVTIGKQAKSTGSSSTAIGKSRASGSNSLAVGISSNSTSYGATNNNSVAFGYNSKTIQGLFSAGNSANAQGSASVAIGNGVTATGVNALAMGQSSTASNTNSIAIGKSATSSIANQIALGGATDTVKISNTYTLPTADGTNGQVLTTDGSGAVTFADAGGGGGADLYAANEFSPTAQPSATGDNAIAIGDSATSTNLNSVAFGAETKSLGNRTAAIGWRAYASGNDAIALATDDNGGTYGAKGGNSWAVLARSQATGSYSQAIGHYTVASGNYSIALGRNATASHLDSIVIGESASSSASDQITLGHTDQTVRISSSYTLPQADGTANQVLTTDGSGAVTFADAGGGGADLFAENYDGTETLPSATGTNAIAIGTQAVATGINSFAGPKSRTTGSNSFSCNLSSTSSSYGAQGTSSVAMGPSAKTTTNYGYALGRNAASTAQYAVILGGYACEASANYAYAFGHRGKAEFIGKYAFGVYTSSTVGSSQGGYMVLARNTTDATAGPLCSTGGTGTGSTDNQVVLPNNSAIAFHGTIVARQQASSGTASAAWKIEGLIRREGSASTTVLVSSTTTVLDNTPSWGMTLSADTTNGALKIEVTGASATNIRWVATVSTSEVTY